jgi:tetratricopeptide (TPR) repeat protein
MSQKDYSDKKPLVISLHGIRTFAPWQKVLADELGAKGFESKTLDYGFLGALKVILPWKRKAQVKWFRDEYTSKIPDGNLPSIICHSFGTYLVARAMENYEGIKFDQIILCGSIIPPDYDWQVLFDRGQVKRVLNECAKKDLVVKASPFFISDAGPSGAYEFDIKNDPRLCQRSVSKFGHSDYLHLLNFRDNWLPFLKGGPPPKDLPPLNKTFNWKIWLTITLLFLLLLSLIIGVAFYAGWKPDSWKKKGNKTTILVADFQSLSGRNRAVSETIIEQLQETTTSYSDVIVQALGETITVQQGSEVAKNKCLEKGGNILLWGWYSESDEQVSVSVYFEMLQPPKDIIIKKRRKLIASRAGFESFKIQEQLSEEMTYVLLLTLGLARFQVEDYEGAIERFTRATEQPVVPEEMTFRTYVYLYRGNSYARKGQFDSAIADFTKAIELNPQDAIAYNNRGNSYARIEQFNLAIADFTKAIELNPQDAIAYSNRGNSYDSKGQFDSAIADFTKAIELNPQDAIASYNRGNSYARIEQFNLAIADFTKAIELNPQDAIAYNNRGNSYDSKGQFDSAIADFTKAIELNPQDAIAYNNRGNSYTRIEQFNLAIADFTKAIELNPSYAIAYIGRAKAYKYNKDINAAILDLKQIPVLTTDQLLRQTADKMLEELKR